MVQIIENIVDNGHGFLNPSYFCIHSTAVPGAPAVNFISQWKRGAPYNTHLICDWNNAYHTVPYDRLCWQVGNGNSYVEGMEICEATTREQFMQTMRIAASVVRQRLTAHGWGIDRLITHDMCRQRWGGTDHTDPNPYFNRFGFSFEQFKQLVLQGDDDMTTSTDVWCHDILSVNNQDQEYHAPAWQLLRDTHKDAWKMSDVILRSDDAGTGDGSSGNIYDRVAWIDYRVRSMSSVLDRTDDAGTQDGTHGNIYDRVAWIDYRVRSMSATITAQAAAIEALAKANGVDPNTVASQVANAVDEKLKTLSVSLTVSQEGEK